MTVCIIDTNQLLDCPNVLEYAVRKHYSVYIPNSVLDELSDVIFRKLDQNGFVQKAIATKKTLDKYENKYQTLDSLRDKNNPNPNQSFADPQILQWILEFMCRRKVNHIIVYTKDKNLKSDINDRIAAMQCIRCDCTIEAKSFYPDNRPRPNNQRNNQENNKSVTYVYTPDFEVIRNDSLVENVSAEDNTFVKMSIISTPSGNANVLRFRLSKAQTGDCIKLFQNFNEKKLIKKGDTINLNFLTFENPKLNIYLELSYNETRKISTKYISVPRGKWTEISFTANETYDYVALCVDVTDNKTVIGFIDNFIITRN